MGLKLKSTIKAKIKRFIERNPPVGKLLANSMSRIEVAMLEVCDFLDKHGIPNFLIRIFKTVLSGRWGSRVFLNS